MGKRIISYSLYGDSLLYNGGMIENVYLAKEIYPDWTVRVYCAKNCPSLPILRTMECEVEEMPEWQGIDRNDKDWHRSNFHLGMFWRYYPISEDNVDYIIIRDADSRLSYREKAAVDEWIASDKLSHRMHEVKEHWNSKIMTGMFGIKGGLFSDIKGMIDKFMEQFPKLKEPPVFADLWFNMIVLWPQIQHSCLGHGHGHTNPFPPYNKNEIIKIAHVGSVVNEHWRDQKFDPDNYWKQIDWRVLPSPK